LPREEAKKTPTPQTVAELKKSNEQTQSSKVEATAIDKTKALENASLSELASEKASEAKADSTAVTAKKEESKKLTLGQKIKKEIAHYWDGTKLLATEVKISSKLALKMAARYELSRRENRQVAHLFYSSVAFQSLTVYSCNEPSKIWVVWFPSRFSSLFHLPNYSFQSLSSYFQIYFLPPMRVRSLEKKRLPTFEKPEKVSPRSCETLFVKQVFPYLPSTQRRKNLRSFSERFAPLGSHLPKKMSSRCAGSSKMI